MTTLSILEVEPRHRSICNNDAQRVCGCCVYDCVLHYATRYLTHLRDNKPPAVVHASK